MDFGRVSDAMDPLRRLLNRHAQKILSTCFLLCSMRALNCHTWGFLLVMGFCLTHNPLVPFLRILPLILFCNPRWLSALALRSLTSKLKNATFHAWLMGIFRQSIHIECCLIVNLVHASPQIFNRLSRFWKCDDSPGLEFHSWSWTRPNARFCSAASSTGSFASHFWNQHFVWIFICHVQSPDYHHASSWQPNYQFPFFNPSHQETRFDTDSSLARPTAAARTCFELMRLPHQPWRSRQPKCRRRLSLRLFYFVLPIRRMLRMIT
jgi:hypothetical protein